MDDPSLDAAEHRRALAGLARINAWSNGAGMLWPALRREAAVKDGPLRVLDLATGSGDLPVALAWRADRAGLPIAIDGCDISPTAIAAASARAAAAGLPARFFVHDVLRATLPPGYDVIMVSLFVHHLASEEIVALLRAMARAAARVVLVNDLNRTRHDLALVWLASRVLSSSPVVRFDGPASVRAALTPPEVLALADEAGLTGATVVRKFPSRWLLRWRKPV